MSKRSTTGYAGPLRALIGDIEAPAPDRVVVVTRDPTLIIPTYLSRSLSTEGIVLPKKYIEANGDDVFARKPIGTGPYKFVEQVVGSHIKMTAVDNHWRIGVPKYKNVTFKLVPEETPGIALIRRGDAGHGLRLRSGARQEAARGRRARRGLHAGRLRVPAPGLCRRQVVRRGGGRLLGEDRREEQAHPGGLSGVPQDVGRPQGARRRRLLQHRQP